MIQAVRVKAHIAPEPRGWFCKPAPAAWFALWVCMLAFMSAHPCGAQQESGKATPKYPVIPPPADVAAPPASAQEASGIATKVLVPGQGNEHPADDDCVRVRFKGWRRDGSLFSSSGLHQESRVQCISAAMPGMAEALKTMVAGEKLRVWIPAHLTFAKKHHRGNRRMEIDQETPPNIDLTYDVEVLEVIKAPPVPGDLKVPPTNAIKTSSGVVFEVLRNGNGDRHPSMTNEVTLNYSGWTSDGKLFETTAMSGHPAIFHVGSALPGWREILPQMVIGEKVRAWIPANLAYGERPVNSMSPAGNLVYDIELLALQ